MRYMRHISYASLYVERNGEEELITFQNITRLSLDDSGLTIEAKNVPWQTLLAKHLKPETLVIHSHNF